MPRRAPASFARHSYVIVAFSLLVFGQAASAQPGDLTGFGFLRLEPSARAAALAGTYGSLLVDDVNQLFYNPAGINGDMHRRIAISYLNHIADINAGFAAYAYDLGSIGTVAGGFRFLSYGRFERADVNGVRDGSSFGASDAAVSVGLSRSFGSRLHYGAALNAIFSSIDIYGAGALTVDAGLLYAIPSAGFGAGITLHHLGLVYDSFGDLADELPFDIRVSLSKRLRHLPLLLSVMAYNLVESDGGDQGIVNDALRHLALGAEFQFSEAFQIRFGYNHRRHEELKTKSRLDLAGFGMGFGVYISRFQFDYAYNAWSSLGGLHQLTVRTGI